MRHVNVLISFIIVALAALAFTSRPASVTAQDATPGTGAAQFPITPDPARCQVEPRSPDELIEIWFGTEGSPESNQASPAAEVVAGSVTIPVGTPADEATASGVVSTVTEVVACFAAGDFGRATALFTDDLTRIYGPEPGTPEEEVRAFLEATPDASGNAETEGEAEVIVAISDVMDLADGRVGAFVVDHSEGRLSTVYAIFE